jgi:hypothetical protein
MANTFRHIQPAELDLSDVWQAKTRSYGTCAPTSGSTPY